MAQSTTEPAVVRFEAGLDVVTVGGLDPAGRDAVLQAWARCGARPVTGGAATADAAYAAGRDWTEFHESLVHTATTRAIEGGRGTHVMLHGACLADPSTGHAIALAAASGTGKTTATRRLGPHLAYLTDETVIVDPASLEVVPFPKPLSLLGPSGRRPKRQAGPDELGLGPAVEARLTRIAVLDRVRDPEDDVAPRVETLDLPTALRLLVPQTSSLSRLPRGLVTLCRILDRLGGVQRLVYAESDGLLPLVQELLRGEPTPLAPAWEALDDTEIAPSRSPAGARTAEAAGMDAAAPLVRRSGADCGVELTDGRLVLLSGERLVFLDGLGPAVWLTLSTGQTAEELLGALSVHGPVPPEAADVLDACLAALAAAGLVTRD